MPYPPRCAAFKRRRRLLEEAGGEGGKEEEEEETPLLTRRGSCVFFYCDVDRKTILRLGSLLREAAEEAIRTTSSSPSPPSVRLYIHSDGGDAYAGLSGMHHIRACPVPVTTVADGYVASAATLLLLAGTERVAVPHSHVLIHQLRTAFSGRYDEMRDEFSNSTRLMDTLSRVYQEETSLSKKDVQRHLQTEVCMEVAECIEVGIVEAELEGRR